MRCLALTHMPTSPSPCSRALLGPFALTVHCRPDTTSSMKAAVPELLRVSHLLLCCVIMYRAAVCVCMQALRPPLALRLQWLPCLLMLASVHLSAVPMPSKQLPGQSFLQQQQLQRRRCRLQSSINSSSWCSWVLRGCGGVNSCGRGWQQLWRQRACGLARDKS